MSFSQEPSEPPLQSLPGHLIRRLQQCAVALFMEETQGQDLTPVQFAALAAAQRSPGMDQRTLAAVIGFDTSTTGGVLDRLESRGLVQRSASPQDRRVRLINATAQGAQMLQAVTPGMLAAQRRILEPLPEAQRAVFMDLLERLVRAHCGATEGDGAGVSPGGNSGTRPGAEDAQLAAPR